MALEEHRTERLCRRDRRCRDRHQRRTGVQYLRFHRQRRDRGGGRYRSGDRSRGSRGKRHPRPVLGFHKRRYQPDQHRRYDRRSWHQRRRPHRHGEKHGRGYRRGADGEAEGIQFYFVESEPAIFPRLSGRIDQQPQQQRRLRFQSELRSQQHRRFSNRSP